MEDLIEQNMGLVVSIVNSFNPKNDEERDDYIQAGRIGLWKAIKNYDPNIGCKFSPYARNPVRWEIIKLISNRDKYKNLSSEESKEQYYSLADQTWELVPDTLTDDEQKALKLKCMGYNFSEICKKLNRGRHYTKKLFSNIFEKMREAND